MGYTSFMILLSVGITATAIGLTVDETQQQITIVEEQTTNATARRGRYLQEIELPAPDKKSKSQIIKIPPHVSRVKLVQPPLNLRYNRAPQQFSRHPPIIRSGDSWTSVSKKSKSDSDYDAEASFHYDPIKVKRNLKKQLGKEVNPWDFYRDEEFDYDLEDKPKKTEKMKKYRQVHKVVKIKRKKPKQSGLSEFMTNYEGDGWLNPHEGGFDSSKSRYGENQSFYGYDPIGSNIYMRQVPPPNLFPQNAFSQPYSAENTFGHYHTTDMNIKKLPTKGRQVNSLVSQQYTTHNPYVTTNFGLGDFSQGGNFLTPQRGTSPNPQGEHSLTSHRENSVTPQRGNSLNTQGDNSLTSQRGNSVNVPVGNSLNFQGGNSVLQQRENLNPQVGNSLTSQGENPIPQRGNSLNHQGGSSFTLTRGLQFGTKGSYVDVPYEFTHAAKQSQQVASSDHVVTSFPAQGPGIQVIQPPQFRDASRDVTVNHPSHPSRLMSSSSHQQNEEAFSQKATIRDILEQDCPAFDTKGYCDSPPRYPMQQIKNMVKKCANLMEVMNTQPYDEPQELLGFARRSDNMEGRVNKSVSLDSELHGLPQSSFYQSSNWSRSENARATACTSDLELTEPGYAKEANSGRWFVIVQHPDTTIQRIATDTCRSPGKSCGGLSDMKCAKMSNPPGKSTRCVQRHTYQRLISWDPESPDECPRMRVFRFPSACICHLSVI